ncbi:MAG: RagB/SusD family nutrient uptake outer membrane protein [Bacteroidales bacterium]|nr:RagB/SusD family nutrient uptake outer membrane protein [Bacteroidales bacterium]
MKKIKIYTFIVFLFTGFMSCNQDDFFKIDRPQETQWVNTISFEQGLSAVYYDLFYSNNGASVPLMIDYVSSGVAHLLPETNTGAPWNEMTNRLFGQNYSLSDNLWSSRYRAITKCNLAIQLDNEKEGNPFDLKTNSTDYTDNYVRQIGEYYFLRAYSYYSLVRFFAPPYDHAGGNTGKFIPFKTLPAYSKEEIFADSLGATEEIYQQIIRDLKVAKRKLPTAYNSATMYPICQIGHANKYVAAAMLAKVYFVMGKYAEAKLELDSVIQVAEGGRYYLDEPIQAFNKNVVTDVPREVLWEVNTGNTAVSGTNGMMYWGMVVGLNFRDADNGGRGVNMVKSDWNQFTFSYWALDKMHWMTDPLNGDYTLTSDATDDLRFQQLYYYLREYTLGGDPLVYETVPSHTRVDKPQLYVDKFFRGAPGDGRYTKYPIIRLADLYLIRAWIKWKTSDPTAANDLNKVWNRAHPTNLNYFNSGNVTEDAIFAEYLKEMTCEGWTLDFMMATQMPIPAGDIARDSIPAPYSSWKWAIPATERSLNPDFQ